MSTIVICDLCGTNEGVESYYLSLYTYRKTGTTRNNSAGRTDLCGGCLKRLISQPPRGQGVAQNGDGRKRPSRCDRCGRVAKGPGGLAAHQRACKAVAA